MPRVLDSSPVIVQAAKPTPVPAPRRSLKRTASAASLPTPPRTRSDKKRLRRDVTGSEEEEEEEEEQRFTSDDEPEEKPLARVLFEPKSVTRSAGKAKKSEKSAEDIFWLGPDVEEERTSVSPKTKGKKKAPSTIGSAPVSPPPSRRNQVGPKFQTPPPVHARTPSTSSSGLGRPLVLPEDDDGPIRDTPNNLFLVDSKKAYPKRSPTKDIDSYEEAPTVTYVFRGKRAEFPNPHYHRSPRADARAKLPPSHPDFSPSPTVKPVRLFDDVENSPKGNKRKKRTSTPSTSPSPKGRNKRKATTFRKRGSPKKAS